MIYGNYKWKNTKLWIQNEVSFERVQCNCGMGVCVCVCTTEV